MISLSRHIFTNRIESQFPSQIDSPPCVDVTRLLKRLSPKTGDLRRLPRMFVFLAPAAISFVVRALWSRDRQNSECRFCELSLLSFSFLSPLSLLFVVVSLKCQLFFPPAQFQNSVRRIILSRLDGSEKCWLNMKSNFLQSATILP